MSVRRCMMVGLALWACEPDPALEVDVTQESVWTGGTGPQVSCEFAERPLYRDGDADGFGDPATWESSCNPIAGYTAVSGDCDDTDARVNPGALEWCDGQQIDEDCDGFADDADPQGSWNPSLWYADQDADGYGAGAVVLACEAPVGAVAMGGDCHDGDGAVHPGAMEVCNGLDDDCDTLTDDADQILSGPSSGLVTFYADLDGDGAGDPTSPMEACVAPAGAVSGANDCDDSVATIHPLAPEQIADGVDSDCDGHELCWPDADGDGYGVVVAVADAVRADLPCQDPGVSAFTGDCDDTTASVGPAAVERCDALGVDEDCDGFADDLDPDGAIGTSVFYADADGDGFGSFLGTPPRCDAPAGHTARSGDCDDGDAAIHPDAVEICSGIDEDCDGLIDDLDGGIDLTDPSTGASTFYLDADLDGYGDPEAPHLACTRPLGYRDNDGDCDDGTAAVHPGASESCDALDNDCDGAIDLGAQDCPLAVQPITAPDGSVYLIVPAFVRLAEAELACNDVGYKLVTLESEGEETFLFDQLAAEGVVPERFWISLYDPCAPGVPGSASGTWSWYDGIHDTCTPVDTLANSYHRLRLQAAPLPPADVYASAPTALIPEPTWQFFAPGIGRRAYVCELP